MTASAASPMLGQRQRWVLLRLSLIAVLIAIASIALGSHDVMAGVSLVQRLIGLMLTLCGIALLAACHLVRSPEGPVGRPGPVGGDHDEHINEQRQVARRLSVASGLFLAGAVPGFLLLALQVRTPRFDWWVLPWLIAALVPLGAFAILWRSYRPRLGIVEPGRALATLVSVAGLIVAGQTILTAYYPPVTRSGALVVTTHLASAGEHLVGANGTGRIQALRGTISIENSGDTKLVLLGGIYMVTGYDVSFRSSRYELRPQALAKELTDLRSEFGVGSYEGPLRIGSFVKTGILFPPGASWVDPGAKLDLSFSAYAPKGRFARYIAAVTLVTARRDRMQFEEPYLYRPQPSQFGEEASVTVHRRIGEASWVNKATRGTRTLYLDYFVPTDRARAPWASVSACIANKRVQCRGLARGQAEGGMSPKTLARWMASYGMSYAADSYVLDVSAK